MNIILGFGLSLFILWAFVFGVKCVYTEKEYRYMAFDETKLLFFISISLLLSWVFLKFMI